MDAFFGEVICSFAFFPYAFDEIVSFEAVEEAVNGPRAYQELEFVVDEADDVVSAEGPISEFAHYNDVEEVFDYAFMHFLEDLSF